MSPWLLTLVGVVVVLMSCNSSVTAKTTLNVVGHWPTDGWQYEAFRQNADAYMMMRPDIGIDFIQVWTNRPEGQAKLVVLMAGGTMPDVIHAYQAMSPEMLQAGLLMPMPSALANEVSRQFLPQVLHGTTYRGQLYGIPTENQVYALGYNQRFLDEGGVAGPPGNWDELRRLAAKLTCVTGDGQVQRYGFAFHSDSIVFVHSLLTFLWSNGGEYIDGAGNIRLTEPPAQATMQYLSELVSLGHMGVDVPFEEAKAAMCVIPSFFRVRLMQSTLMDYSDVRTTQPPNGAGPRSSCMYGWGFYVASQTRQSKEAWEFLRWLTVEKTDKGPTRMSNHMIQLGSMPANRSDVARTEYREPYFRGLVDCLEIARPEPLYPETGLRQQEFRRILLPALKGSTPIGTALIEAQQRIGVILSGNK